MYKFLFKVHVISALMILSTGYSNAQNLNLIPYPSQVEVLKGNCVLYNSQLFTNNKELSGLLRYFNIEMGRQQKNSHIPNQVIDLKILPSSGAYGSYELVTFEKQVAITAPDSAGLFNGLVTLLQLYKSANLLNNKLVLPHVVIHDQPRFVWQQII
jgi:hexosaminidase